jgi:hypothetical protein
LGLLAGLAPAKQEAVVRSPRKWVIEARIRRMEPDPTLKNVSWLFYPSGQGVSPPGMLWG